MVEIGRDQEQFSYIWKTIFVGFIREEIIVNRLHAGHWHGLHDYLMDNDLPVIPPIYE